jgi:hypothetical protein
MSHVIDNPRRTVSEAAPWVRGWKDRSLVLIDLLAAIDGDALAAAAALLAWVRECRRSLGAPPDPRLRSLCRRILEETWEAACSTLYGDLGPARQHAEAALQDVRDVWEILDALD